MHGSGQRKLHLGAANSVWQGAKEGDVQAGGNAIHGKRSRHLHSGQERF